MKKYLAILGFALPVAASGHVVLSPAASPAGAYYAGVLRVGHGCDGAATTEVQVTIPASVRDAKPQPKPGWTVDTMRDGGRVTGLAWKGSLPDAQFDEFGIMLVLDPAATGPLYLPVVQRCGLAEKRWTETSGAGAKSPAPMLMVTPKDAMEHMNH